MPAEQEIPEQLKAVRDVLSRGILELLQKHFSGTLPNATSLGEVWTFNDTGQRIKKTTNLLQQLEDLNRNIFTLNRSVAKLETSVKDLADLTDDSLTAYEKSSKRRKNS